MARLLVHAEPADARIICRAFDGYGFDVSWTGSGLRARAKAAADTDLVVVGTPDAVQFCTDVRAAAPTLMLVTRPDLSEDDVVAALDAGADDVLVHPERHLELVARVRALLRPRAVRNRGGIPRVWTAGALRVSDSEHTVTLNGEPVQLPLTQFLIIRHLVRHAGKVVRRRELLDEVWGPEFVDRTKTLDTHMRSLRKQLEADGRRRISTVRRVGFRLDA